MLAGLVFRLEKFKLNALIYFAVPSIDSKNNTTAWKTICIRSATSNAKSYEY